jgi:hypothetical protein
MGIQMDFFGEKIHLDPHFLMLSFTICNILRQQQIHPIKRI